MRFTARRLVAIVAIALTTFAATHTADVSHAANGVITLGATHSTATTVQASGIPLTASSNGIIDEF